MNHYSYRSILLAKPGKLEYFIEGVAIIISTIIITLLTLFAVYSFTQKTPEEEINEVILDAPIEAELIQEGKV